MEALCAKFPLLHCVHSSFSVLGLLLLIRQGLTLVPMAGLQWVALLPRALCYLEGHFSYTVVQTVLGLAMSWSNSGEGRKKVEREGWYSGII